MSYFAAVTVGLCLAVVTAVILTRPHYRATAATAAKKLGTIIRRIFPVWLVLAVLLGFVSVSYFDCGHSNYTGIVNDRPHLIHKTQEQVSAMALYLAVAVVTYGFVLLLFLWVHARQSYKNSRSG